MAKKKKKVTGLKVYGNALTAILRTCYDNGDADAVMGLLRGRTCGEILDVCKGEAEIRGNNVDGFDIFYLTED